MIASAKIIILHKLIKKYLVLYKNKRYNNMYYHVPNYNKLH